MKESQYKKIKLKLTPLEFSFFCSQFELFNLKRKNALILLSVISVLGALGFCKLYPIIPQYTFTKILFILLWLFFGFSLLGGYFLIEDIYAERFAELIEFLTPKEESFEGEEIKNGNE